MLFSKPQLRLPHGVLSRHARATIADPKPTLAPFSTLAPVRTAPPPASPPTILQPPLSLSEYNLIFSRRVQNLNLPDNPHLLLSESLSANLTSLFALLFKLHLLQTPPVTTLRTSHRRIFHALRALSLSQLPPLRLLSRPLLRLVPPLHWLTTPFHLFATPFLLDTLYQLLKSRLRARATPTPVQDLHHLRNHISESLTTTRDNLSNFISKKTAELRHEVEIKLPPPLHIPGPPPLPPRASSASTTDSATDSFKTPTTGRADGARLRTPSKPRQRMLSRGLGSFADGDSPHLSLLPSSIARVVDTPSPAGFVASAPAAVPETGDKVDS